MLNKDLGVFNFDSKEKSDLEKFVNTLKSSNSENGKFDCIRISDETTKYIYDLINNHKYYIAQRKIYETLGELEKNDGLESFKAFLKEYISEKTKLNKASINKWRENGFDFFISKLGIKFSVAIDSEEIEKDLLKKRNKINDGINFTYDEVEEETGNEYRICIPNREVPEYLANLNFNSEVINRLLYSYKSNFVNKLFELSQKDFVRLYNELEITKKTFQIIIEKINHIKKDKGQNLKKFVKDKETDLNFNIELSNKADEAIDKWVDEGVKGDAPKYEFKESNINYIYNPGNDSITFKVYYQNKRSNKNDNTLIYQFIHYFCEKKSYNNSYVPRELIHENIPEEKIELNKNKIQNKKISIGKDLKELLRVSDELKARTKNLSINRKKIEKAYISKLINTLSENNEYKTLKSFFDNPPEDYVENQRKCLVKLEDKNAEIVDLKTDINWLGVFIKQIRSLLLGDKNSFQELGSGLITDEEKIINDPFVQENNLYNDSIKLKLDYKRINGLLKDISINKDEYENFSDTIRKVLYVDKHIRTSEYSYIFTYKQRLDKYTRKIKRLYVELEVLLENDTSKNVRIVDKKANVSDDKNKVFNKKLQNKKNEIAILDKKIKNLSLFIDEFKRFRKNLSKIKKVISRINFKKLLISKISDKNIVYKEKDLTKIIIGLIFKNRKVKNGEINKNKVKRRLENVFDGGDEFNIDLFINDLCGYYNYPEISGNKEAKIREYLNLLENSELYLNDKLENCNGPIEKDHEQYFIKTEEVGKVLSSVFNEDVVESYNMSIDSFVANFVLAKPKEFDKALAELIEKIGLENDPKFSSKKQQLDDFEDYHNEIMSFQLPNYDLDLVTTSKGFDEKSENIRHLKEDLKFKNDMVKVIAKNLKNSK